MTISGSSGLIFPDGSGQETGIGRNRIINGAMVIDQRNAGASIGAGYAVDRFAADNGTDGVFTQQQVTDAPAGFNYSVKITVTTADASITAGQYSSFFQAIEGYNLADFNWGTANAKTVTLSFWVKSSLTGTFGGSLRGASNTRSYPYTYTISVANTWEYKTVTIVGETSGTWIVNNGSGVQVFFNLGTGTTLSGTAGAWASASYRNATGTTNVLETLNATWYITGVQLEQNTAATPFERRLYGQELANCQRYYIRYGYPVNTPADGQRFATAIGSSSTEVLGIIPTPCSMRATPTSTYSSVGVGNSAGVAQLTSLTTTAIHSNSIYVVGTFASGISSNSAYQFRYYSVTAFMDFSAEL